VNARKTKKPHIKKKKKEKRKKKKEVHDVGNDRNPQTCWKRMITPPHLETVAILLNPENSQCQR